MFGMDATIQFIHESAGLSRSSALHVLRAAPSFVFENSKRFVKKGTHRKVNWCRELVVWLILTHSTKTVLNTNSTSSTFQRSFSLVVTPTITGVKHQFCWCTIPARRTFLRSERYLLFRRLFPGKIPEKFWLESNFREYFVKKHTHMNSHKIKIHTPKASCPPTN